MYDWTTSDGSALKSTTGSIHRSEWQWENLRSQYQLKAFRTRRMNVPRSVSSLALLRSLFLLSSFATMLAIESEGYMA